MDRCTSCQRDGSLHDFLNELTGEEDEEITFKKWTQTDGTKLETITEDKEEFIESLVKLISNLTSITTSPAVKAQIFPAVKVR